MPPKKAKDLVKPTAEKLELNIELVQDVIDFYWKKVRTSLSDLKSPRIVVANFGSFQIKAYKLEDQRKKYQDISNSFKPEEMTFQKHKIKEDIDAKLAKVTNMMSLVESDKDRKKQVRKKRYAK